MTPDESSLIASHSPYYIEIKCNRLLALTLKFVAAHTTLTNRLEIERRSYLTILRAKKSLTTTRINQILPATKCQKSPQSRSSTSSRKAMRKGDFKDGVS